jgi:hypothetical protein
LERYLQQQGFIKGNVDNHLYIKVTEDSILLIEVYVDDIIFGSDDDRLSQKISKDIDDSMFCLLFAYYKSLFVHNDHAFCISIFFLGLIIRLFSSNQYGIGMRYVLNTFDILI